ncbi:hypothetical protein ACIO13_26090 [Streptomyces sp. NPDC087425]|uniref:hypothetical protein n=1 Tax=Streptomyces sp. NPDC087425 TaxID=3365787 RepID=UPI003828A396
MAAQPPDRPAPSSLMAEKTVVPVGVKLSTDIEHRPDRPNPYRARVRWFDPTTKRRLPLSEGKSDEDEAREWLQTIIEAAQAGLSPSLATMKLAEYGDTNMHLALRGLELKTLDPYLAGWRMRVVPALGHLAVRMITNGVVDRSVQNWIVDEHSRSTVKNTIAVLVRVMEQAVRDGIIKVNPARVSGWQKPYKQTEDELLDPRALALPDWDTLVQLAEELVAASYNQYRGWGDVVRFAASTPPGSAKSPGAASQTSTPANGSGPCGARPHPLPADSPTRAPRASAPGRFPSSRRSVRS